MMTDKRIPLAEESISGSDAVHEYDSGARYIMAPQYLFFAWKILIRGIKGGAVLDIGTGTGRLTIELAKIRNNSFDITGIDISDDMIIIAQENAKHSKVTARTKFIAANASALPFGDRSFDLVISYASLHHWRDPIAVFNEAARVVKDSGRIIIRDNIRVYQSPLWRSFIWFLTRFMNKRHRENWPMVIRACYTIPEIKEILGRSNLKDYRVTSDFIGIDMCIESPRK